MISYYPLEDDEPPPPKFPGPGPGPVPVQVPVTSPENSLLKLFNGETTECNYLVFAFIMGVLFLALTDAMKR